jgi:hypothetical protein
MDSKLQAVIDKIQKLRALAGNNSSLEEANAATAAANRLIDEYRLSESELATNDPTLDPMEEDEGYIYTSGKITPWKAYLIKVLARHYGVAHFNDITKDLFSGRKVSRYKLVGRKSDMQITNYMYAWLVLTCQQLSDQEAKGRGRIYIASYCSGFVEGIKEQLAASRLQAQITATSMAIVRLDSRRAEARAFMYANNTNLRSVRSASYSQKDGDGFAAGKERGESIHLGSALGSAGSKGVRLLGQ